MTLCVTAFDRSGERHWNKKTSDDLRGSRVFGIFVFDDEVLTNCCEFTPSYDLMWVGHVTIPSDELDAHLETLSDEDRDSFYEFENEGEDGCYVHCGDVDNNPTTIAYRERDPEETSEDDLESLRDCLSGNGHYPDYLRLDAIARGEKPQGYSSYDLRYQKEVAAV